MTNERMVEVEAVMNEHLCSSCGSVDDMREDLLDEGYSYECLKCGWQIIIRRDEVLWVESEVPALKLSTVVDD